MSRIRLSRRRVFASSLVAVVVVAGALFWISRNGESDAVAADASTQESIATVEESQPAVPVEIRAAEVADLPNFYHATGNLRARRSVDLIAKVTGQVTRLDFEEGHRVGSGELLLEVDSREQALKVEESAVRVETAKSELTRMQDMAERGLETDRAYEEASQTFRVNRAQHQMEEVRLEDHQVRSPFAGTVVSRDVELGQTVQAGSKLLTVADLSTLEVQLHLPENAVARLRVGQPVEVRADGAGFDTLPGTVLRISPAVDAATSTVKVTLSVENPRSKVRAGSFVRAKITTDVHENVICVPRKALVAEAGSDYVFIAEADTVRKVSVETGYADDDRIEIVHGIAATDHVVIVGQGGLRTGSRVVAVDSEGRSVGATPEATPDATPEATEVAQNK